jgi:hypothetical protein
MKFTVLDYPDYSLEIETGGSVDEVLKVKRLPGRVYNPARNAWVIPIRPGLGEALESVYGVTVAEPVRHWARLYDFD